MEVKQKLNLYILAQGADAGPPLGTILGNLGVNSSNFCKEFNTVTADLPPYVTTSVTISVFTNRTFKMEFNGLPLGKIIGLLKFERTIKGRGGKEEMQMCIRLPQIVQLAKFRFPHMAIDKSVAIILGSIKSCHLTIL